jgi:hypothetical protein
MVVAALVPPCQAEPLDWNGFTTVGAELFINRMDGSMGFERQQGGTGTWNHFQEDLGLPAQTWQMRLNVSVRPLEHHLVRMYGCIPETYKGSNVLTRDLVTKNYIYNQGTAVQSEARVGMLGFGYDLDFVVGPRWWAGLNGDLRYLDYRVRFGGTGIPIILSTTFPAPSPPVNNDSVNTGVTDTVAITEVTPCIGAHFQTRIPVLDQRFPRLGVGIFGRMTYGMTPNFLNYYDLSTGATISLASAGLPFFDAKLAYELEGAQQQNIEGKDLDYQRAGFLASLQVAF